MTTKEPIQSFSAGLRTGFALLLTALVAAVAATAVTAGTTARDSHLVVGTVRVVSTTISTRQRTWTYGWPVKPFNRQHPVRAFLNDPRIGSNGGTAFHFGIDVSAPDGTAVYAVEGGEVYFDSPAAIAVVAPDRSHSFGYWHIVPVVKSHQLVARHQLLGYVGRGWEHVHFAERRGAFYVNPLRDGGIGPYVDHTAPTVASVSLLGTNLVAVAYDTPKPRVPGAWGGLPVTPALIQLKVGRGQWRTVVDFRNAMLDRSRFSKIYTPETRQNHRGEAGCFSFYLVHGFTGRNVTVEIRVSDMSGNATVVVVPVRVAV
jgi:hypothetical protein